VEEELEATQLAGLEIQTEPPEPEEDLDEIVEEDE